MHALTTTLASLAAWASIANSFKMTWPSEDALDLSGPIELKWETNGGGNPEYNYLTIVFNYKDDEIEGATYFHTVKGNISLPTQGEDSYTWDPEELVQSVADSDRSFSGKKVHTFEAKRHMENSTFPGSGEKSGEYEVEGVDNIGSGGISLGVSGWVVALGAVGSVAAMT